MHRTLIALAACCVSLSSLTAFGALAVIPSPSDDLALAGVGYSSSTGFGGTPDHINDGNRNGIYHGPGVDNSISHSAGPAPNQFMGVYFTGAHEINQINIFNRPGFESRLDGSGTVPFKVDLFSGGTAGANYTDGTNIFSQAYTYLPSIFLTDIPSGDTANGMVIKLGQFYNINSIRVTQINNDYMNLAEIEVFAPEPSSLVLAGLAAVGLTGYGIKRRRRTA